MRNIIVTGACGGIGNASIMRLLEDKDRQILAIDMDVEAVKEKYKGMERCIPVVCDLLDEDSIRCMMKGIVSEYGPVSGLLHCAGFDKLSPLYLCKTSDAEALMKIHYLSALNLCKYLSKRGNFLPGCSIVFISSLSAHEGALGHPAYAAAKGALEGMLPSAAAELAEKQIRINIMVLGVIMTSMSMGYIGRMDDSQKEALEKQYPLGLGKPEYVANLVNFLMSDESSWMTGQKIVLDGGHQCRRV